MFTVQIAYIATFRLPRSTQVANRIAKGTFTLDGTVYHTPINEQSAEGGDTLHGGNVGFDRRSWTVIAVNASSVTLSLLSADMDMGFPGDLLVNVTHLVSDAGTWSISYSAMLVSGSAVASTVIGMTNHAYFNLGNYSGAGEVLDHELNIDAGSAIAVDTALIPTGVIDKVSTDFWLDFQTTKVSLHTLVTRTTRGRQDLGPLVSSAQLLNAYLIAAALVDDRPRHYPWNRCSWR